MSAIFVVLWEMDLYSEYPQNEWQNELLTFMLIVNMYVDGSLISQCSPNKIYNQNYRQINRTL